MRAWSYNTYFSNIVMYLPVKTKLRVTMPIMFYMRVATADPPLSDVIIQCRWLAHIDDDEVTGLRVLEYRPTWDDDCSVSFLSDCLPLSVWYNVDPFEKKMVKGKHHALIIFFDVNIYANYVRILVHHTHTHTHTPSVAMYATTTSAKLKIWGNIAQSLIQQQQA